MTARTQIAAGLIAVVSALTSLPGTAQAQDLRALARAHAAKNAEAPLVLTGPPGDYQPKNVHDLARESDVVLRGTLTPIATYLGPNEDRILTDYRIDVEQLLAGKMPPMTSEKPSNIPPRVLTVYGGELRLEGVWLRASDPNREEIVAGKSYLLFLMPSRRDDPGYYEIYHGGIFEVSSDGVKPLLKGGNKVFKDIAGSAIEDVIANVKMARRGP
jgi:hypothetical protein